MNDFEGAFVEYIGFIFIFRENVAISVLFFVVQ